MGIAMLNIGDVFVTEIRDVKRDFYCILVIEIFDV